MIGLEKDRVRLEPYSDQWRFLFEEEAQLLRAIVGQFIIAIEHVGSTAIVGLKAKPIIDILAGIGQLQFAEEQFRSLRSIGYEYDETHQMPGSHLFVKGSPTTHHLHITKVDSDFWRDHILFRNYLREHPTVATEYVMLKERLAKRYETDRVSYTASKDLFIKKILAMAKS